MSMETAQPEPPPLRRLSPREAVGRAFEVLRADPGPGLGLGLFAFAFQCVGVIPWIGWLIALLATPAATAGCYRYALEAVRREKPVFEVTLSGFRRWWAVTSTLGLSVAIPMLAAAPLLGVAGAMAFVQILNPGDPSSDWRTSSLRPVLLALVVIFLPLFLWLIPRCSFALFAVMDAGGTGAVAAVKRSWELTRGSFWRVFGLLLILSLFMVLGLMLFGVGLIAALPVTYFARAHAYEQLRARFDALTARGA